jgi:hypothetical protein
MSCEEARKQEVTARRRLNEAEQRYLKIVAPLLGKVTLVTAEESEERRLAGEAYVEAMRAWFNAVERMLSGVELHRT